nr:alpha/beta hydrolases superfamily protein [Tanacetum cinerariifolium]
MIIKKDSKIVKSKGERRSLALKAKKESNDEECLTFESEKEEYAMAVRDFKKFFKRRGRFEKNKRAFVGCSWSDSGEKDDEKAKDETCLMPQASSEVHSESSYFSDENWCGEPLYGFSPCQWYTYERCGNDMRNGFCSLCNSRNSCVYDPNLNSFDCSPDSYHPSHPTYETDSGDSCRNDSHFGYDCSPQFLINYEPEPGYIQNYNSYPHDSPSFPHQYLCCDNCGGPHETFQCQPINQNFYNFNSSGFDQSQHPQFPVIHPPPQETSIEILHDQENAINSVQTFLRKFNRISFFETPKDIQELLRELFNDVQNIHDDLSVNTPGWNRPAFYNNGDDDDEDCTIAVTPDFPITDSLIMENEHLDTIPETESDEFIKSSVENLVSIPSDDLFLERLLHDNPISLPDTLDFSIDVRVFLPFFTYPYSWKFEDSYQRILSSKSSFS